jgi:hypothetical protein
MNGDNVLTNIARFKTTTGKKTCSLNTHDKASSCKFLGIERFGTRFSCLITNKELKCYSGTDDLKPLHNCVVWSKE